MARRGSYIDKYISTFRLFKKTFGDYKWHIVVIIVLGLVSSILEGLGISSVIPIFSFLGGQAGYASDTISHFITVFFNFIGLNYTFRSLIFFTGFLLVSRTVLLFIIQYITARIVFGYEKEMRDKLFSYTSRSRWSYLSKQKVGHLDQLLITNTTNSSQFFAFLSTLVLIFTKLLIYTIIVVNISKIIALATLVIGLIVFIILRPIFYKNKILSSGLESLNRKLAHFISQHIVGMKSIKSSNIEKQVEEKGTNYFENMRKYNVNMTVLRGATEMLIRFIGLGFVAVVFVILYRLPGFNFAAFAVIVYAINQSFTQIQAAQTQLHALSAMVPYLSNVLLHIETSRTEAEIDNGKSSFSFSNTLQFKDVDFSYPDRGQILKNINFKIKQGEMIGIIGPSGSGKTTIVDLLLRLYDPETGKVFIDENEIREITLSSWRSNIGYVTQDMFLINDTIKNNIIFYGDNVSLDDVKKVAAMANINEFIESLPEGYDSVIGDRGVLLSGGQRQRLTLARALLRNPKILILDEATSSLDNESELAIQKSIESLKGKITVIVIAHRLSTVSKLDHLIVLDRGKIIEEGDPQKMLKDTSSYLNKVANLGNNKI